MKKIYMTPSLKVANIILPTLLADSTPTIEADTNPENGSNVMESKKSSLFDM